MSPNISCKRWFTNFKNMVNHVASISISFLSFDEFYVDGTFFQFVYALSRHSTSNFLRLFVKA